MGERSDEQHYAKDYGNVAIGAGLTLDDQLDTQQTLALLVDSISNGYDVSGRLRLSTKTSADGSITMTSRNYDGLNRVVTYDDGTNVLQYTYNADDTVARLDVGTSSYNVYTYDTVGNLRSQTSKKTSNNDVLGTYDYTYVMGASGYQQKTIAASANGHTNTTTYDYDFRGQLTRVDNPSESTKSYFAYSTDGKIATKLENATGSTPSQTIERRRFDHRSLLRFGLFLGNKLRDPPGDSTVEGVRKTIGCDPSQRYRKSHRDRHLIALRTLCFGRAGAGFRWRA